MKELLSPAGSREAFSAAINNGADAVYLGLKNFSARNSADNFSEEELKFCAAYAKFFGAKVYVAVNTLVKNAELDDFFNAVERAARCGADAFIVQDMFLGKRLKREFPEIILHLSTQAGVCNVFGAQLAADYGFNRAILARETPLKDIEKISKIIETEVFIQGALCSSFSGHCYISSFIGGNSGNRGLCKQPCRKKYSYTVNGKTYIDGYALSLSDLSVGENIFKFIDAGVSSFKIEGRMRRPEYVAAATAYYRDILDGNKADISLLKRTFNRGDYTKGLAFGQDNGFISSSVQGNIGEKIGSISYIDKDYIKLNAKVCEGDAFKILRGGKEVGSAVCTLGGVKYTGALKTGDEVRITTDVKLNKKLLSKKRLVDVNVSVFIKENEPVKIAAESNGVKAEVTAAPPAAAIKAPLTLNDVTECFNKTGEYPFNVKISAVLGKSFMPKSVLNDLRRTVYDRLFYGEAKAVKRIKSSSKNRIISNINNIKNISILQGNFDFDGIKVIFPYDYNDVVPVEGAYLYLPAFACGDDLTVLDKAVKGFDGIYADGYYGIEFAKKHGKKIIFGTGINVFNKEDIAACDTADIVLSKELSETELKEFPRGCRVFALGNVPLMELIYCPFSKACENCPADGDIRLIDEDGREFRVRRYKLSGCRFVIYNAYDLIPKKLPSCALFFDFSAEKQPEFYLDNLNNTEKLRSYIKYTNGNLIKGIN